MSMIDRLITKYEEKIERINNIPSDPSLSYKELNNYRMFLSELKDLKLIQTKKLLLVEDGSIDLDNEEETLNNMGYKVLVYRQGANKPEILERNNVTN